MDELKLSQPCDGRAFASRAINQITFCRNLLLFTQNGKRFTLYESKKIGPKRAAVQEERSAMNISCHSRPMVVLACSILPMTATASHAPEAAASSSQQLQSQLDEQACQIESIGQAVADQETRHPVLQRLSAQEPCTLAGASSRSPTQPATNTSQRTVNVGSAPSHKRQPPAVAPLFDQPGILTSKGKFVLEPSLQNVYSSSNRLELQARLPYVYWSDTTVSREIFTGSAPDHAFINSGKAMGDVELASLLLESFCRYSNKTAFSVTAGAGVTRDTPDLSLTLRVPLLF